MKDETGTRLRRVRRLLDFSQKDFSEEIGIKQGSLSDIERGRTGISSKISEILSRKFNVSEAWLRNGIGDIFTNTVYINKLNESKKSYSEVIEKINSENSSGAYQLAQSIGKQILLAHHNDLKSLIIFLNKFFQLQSKLLQFINQYDKYLLPGNDSEIFAMLNEGKTETEITSGVGNTLKNVKQITPLFQKYNEATQTLIDELKAFDPDDELNKTRWLDFKKHIHMEYEKEAQIKSIFNILGKNYPPIDESLTERS